MANAGVGAAPGSRTRRTSRRTNPTQLDDRAPVDHQRRVSCDLTLNGQVDPSTAMSGHVTLNGMTLTYGTDWTVLADGMTLELEGTACSTLQSSSNPTVTASFPCGSVIE